jgi:hypothetical protein
MLQEHGQSSKPIFDTEGSWNPQGGPEDPIADIARLYILQASEGVSLVMWYSWDNRKLGTLWTPEEGSRPAAKAYEQLQDWLIGTTFDGPCENKGGTWTCELHKNNAPARIVWSAKPGAGNYKVPDSFTSQLDLSGAATPLKGGSVPLSNRPILLQSKATP